MFFNNLKSDSFLFRKKLHCNVGNEVVLSDFVAGGTSSVKNDHPNYHMIKPSLTTEEA
jgi:hypothetical protein